MIRTGIKNNILYFTNNNLLIIILSYHSDVIRAFVCEAYSKELQGM